MLFPFRVPIYIPRFLSNAISDMLSALRVISPRQNNCPVSKDGRSDRVKKFIRIDLPVNFVTAPLVADLFLLAISAIGRKEVHDGTVGANDIAPLDIMAFFLFLAYTAISIDASGLIRYLAYKVLQKGGEAGYRLYFYLYAFFFILAALVGNDPVILSGTPFLAYMTRVSSNIVHPRAWIFSQFAIANIASAILVSSNPTNLVLAGAFNIKFIHYTANVTVPVAVTAIVLFPFLLCVVFANESLVPRSIEMHELPEEAKAERPVNPNIPYARGNMDEQENKLLSLEEIMNPFLDKPGAWFGAAIMGASLTTILTLNAASQSGSEHPVFWITLPASFIMFCWDAAFGWLRRHETREMARKGRQEVELAQAERAVAVEEGKRGDISRLQPALMRALSAETRIRTQCETNEGSTNWRGLAGLNGHDQNTRTSETSGSTTLENVGQRNNAPTEPVTDPEKRVPPESAAPEHRRATLSSLVEDAWEWSRETFPTVTAVAALLPLPLVLFAFSMFVLVQALVTKGWVPVFAYGWDHWVNKTGTIGAIGGMGFLSVVLTNVSLPSYENMIKMNTERRPVRRHKHRHDDSPISRHASVAGDPSQQRDSNLRPDVLGERVQHGPWHQLRRIQHDIQRIAGWSSVERYTRKKAHSCPESRVCAREPPHNHGGHGRWLRCSGRRDLHHERRFAL